MDEEKKVVKRTIKLSDMKGSLYTVQISLTVLLMLLIGGGLVFLFLSLKMFSSLPDLSTVAEAQMSDYYSCLWVGRVSMFFAVVLPIFSIFGIIGIWSRKEEKIVYKEARKKARG